MRQSDGSPQPKEEESVTSPRRYTPELREKCANLALRSGAPAAGFSQDAEIYPETLGLCIKSFLKQLRQTTFAGLRVTQWQQSGEENFFPVKVPVAGGRGSDELRNQHVAVRTNPERSQDGATGDQWITGPTQAPAVLQQGGGGPQSLKLHPAAPSRSAKPSGFVLQLRVSLAHIHPMIWRRLLVPANIPLSRLHQVIQATMGWQNCHLHVFNTPAGDFGPPDDGLGHRNEQKIHLHAVASKPGDRIDYIYDLADEWVHHIKIEKILPHVPGVIYPRCAAGKRACPPEDCGGPWGYAEILAAINNPKHEQHQEVIEWLNGPYDPDHLNLDEINQLLSKLSQSQRKPLQE
ncbi:plasmid pRiA4b ORF-3 family protein [Streptomyces sp. NPDC001635]|nr:plasmid pRiA4b ORF-3 family protein [Streptomyces sp. T1317-0309]